MPSGRNRPFSALQISRGTQRGTQRGTAIEAFTLDPRERYPLTAATSRQNLQSLMLKARVTSFPTDLI